MGSGSRPPDTGWSWSRRQIALAGAAAIVVALIAGLVLIGRYAREPLPVASASPSATQSVPATTVPIATVAPRAKPHVLVIIEENRGYAATLGSCSADRYFCALAATQGISSDCTPDGGGCGPFAAPDLGTQLTGAGIPWVAYMESMPTRCGRAGSSGAYAEKHNPFIYFAGNRGPACANHVVPYPGPRGMLAALDSSNLPDFVWITPNLQNDMHDGSVTRGDAWLAANLPAVLASRWFADDGTKIVTMDENDASSSGSCCAGAHGGRVPMVVISARAHARGATVTPGDHYGPLRSIEECSGCRSSAAPRAHNMEISARCSADSAGLAAFTAPPVTRQRHLRCRVGR